MTVPHHSEPAREAVAAAFRRMHRNTCYPDASDGEALWAADEIIKAYVSASPAPAAGVEAVREIEAIFRRHLQANDYAKDLIKRIAFDVVPAVRKALSAALASPAATRGEPVALNRQAIRDAIAAASRSGAMGWADHEIDEATDDLVDALAHPAPAESAQVKVKPLVWLDNGHGLYSADEGRYVVDATRAAEDSKVLLLLPCAPTERFDRVVDAIAAAQTKQEAAIRASLATDAEG